MKKMERNVDYVFSQGMAITLGTDQVLANHRGEVGMYSRTHNDGWTIEGSIFEDYCYWVNEFVASHPVHGQVSGDFEEEVFATSHEGFKNFYENHTPNIWDYHDI